MKTITKFTFLGLLSFALLLGACKKKEDDKPQEVPITIAGSWEATSYYGVAIGEWDKDFDTNCPNILWAEFKTTELTLEFVDNGSCKLTEVYEAKYYDYSNYDWENCTAEGQTVTNESDNYTDSMNYTITDDILNLVYDDNSTESMKIETLTADQLVLSDGFSPEDKIIFKRK